MQYEIRTTCPECRGTGRTRERANCGRCWGSGQSTITKRVPEPEARPNLMAYVVKLVHAVTGEEAEIHVRAADRVEAGIIARQRWASFHGEAYDPDTFKVLDVAGK